MECPACGNRKREGARFCDGWGATLEGDAGGAPERAAPPPPSAPPPGDIPDSIADGRYRVQRFLGERGRKSVYLARDTAEEREVALAVFGTEGVEETVLSAIPLGLGFIGVLLGDRRRSLADVIADTEVRDTQRPD